MKIMASVAITSWQIGGETIETSDRLYLFRLQNHCRWWLAMKLKDACSLEEKLTNLDSILKSRDITLLAKVCIVKAMVFFSVIMYGRESWTTKNAEWQRIGTFELWCGGRLLRAPWTARRSNQSILKEINPEYPLETEGLKLWPHDIKSWLTGRDSDVGKNWWL